MAEDNLWKLVQRKIAPIERVTYEVTGLVPSDKQLFRAGIIGPEEYDALFRLEYELRWWTSGKYRKRGLSKARRRAWKTGRLCSFVGRSSECNRKGT